MPKFYIEVWASVGSCHTKEIVEVDQKDPPTDGQMQEEYRDTIGNIMDSGYGFATKEEYNAYHGITNAKEDE